MPRLPRRSFAILGLLLVHGLADVAVGVFRTQEVSVEFTDVAAAALSRSQLCLLTLWLAAGADPLSWRLCGFVGGVCFLFVIYSRTALPGEYGIGAGTIWLEEEWRYYFRLSGPGDLLLKAPFLMGGIAAPVLGWRLWRACRGAGERAMPKLKQFNWRRLQFGMGEAALWILTLSVAMAAVFRTAPYPEWFGELAKFCRTREAIPGWAYHYVPRSALLYVLLIFAATWLVFGKSRVWLRGATFLVIVAGLTYCSEHWLSTRLQRSGETADSLVWSQASGEMITSVSAVLLAAASLALYKAYGPAPAP